MKFFFAVINSTTMPLHTEDALMDFARTLGASNPWIFLALVCGLLALRFYDGVAKTKQQRFTIVIMSYCVVAGILHVIAVFVMQSTGPTWQNLQHGLWDQFIVRVCGRFVLFPLKMWPIYGVVMALWATFVELTRPFPDPNIIAVGALVFNLFVVGISLWLD